MASYPLRWRPLILVGLVCGLVQVIVGVVMYLSGAYFEPWSVQVMIVLLAACIAVGNWWYGKHVLGHLILTWKKANQPDAQLRADSRSRSRGPWEICCRTCVTARGRC